MGNSPCSPSTKTHISSLSEISTRALCTESAIANPSNLPPLATLQCRATFVKISALQVPNQIEDCVEAEEWEGDPPHIEDFPILRAVLTSSQHLACDGGNTVKVTVNCGSFTKIKNKHYLEQYVFVKELGKGSKGPVVKVRSKCSRKMLRAVKLIKEGAVVGSYKKKVKLLSEIAIPFELDHPNIAKVHEVFEWRQNLGVVMELCEGGDLFAYMQKSKKFSQTEAARLFQQIMRAVYYMHSRGICHRDLKPQNILYDTETNLLKIIDFETAARFTSGQRLNNGIGNLYYTAPEMFGGSCDQKCDIWACGVILYLMLSGYPPFQDHKRQNFIQKIQNTPVSFKGRVWLTRSEQAKELIMGMLKKDPAMRPSAKEVLGSSWVMGQSKLNGPMKTIIGTDLLGNLRNFHFKNKLKAVVYTYIASQLYDGKNKQNLMAAFREIDQDGDGVIGIEQLEKIFQSEEGSALSRQEVGRIVKMVDTNGSGRIDFTEFIVAATNENDLLKQKELESAFNYLDSDQSGFISLEEVVAFLEGAEQASQQIKAIFDVVDGNGDGQINKKEFIALLIGKENEEQLER